MSAIKDPQRNLTFVYSNFYQIYRNGKLKAAAQGELTQGIVLKTHSLTETPSIAEIRVISSQQTEELTQWSHAKDEGKKEMANHLLTLREARKRLTFWMTELDELLKRS